MYRPANPPVPSYEAFIDRERAGGATVVGPNDSGEMWTVPGIPGRIIAAGLAGSVAVATVVNYRGGNLLGYTQQTNGEITDDNVERLFRQLEFAARVDKAGSINTVIMAPSNGHPNVSAHNLEGLMSAADQAVHGTPYHTGVVLYKPSPDTQPGTLITDLHPDGRTSIHANGKRVK